MTSPWPVIGICIFYAFFVFKLGPHLMKNRRAFNIDPIVNVYNLIQIASCSYIIYKVSDLMLQGVAEK